MGAFNFFRRRKEKYDAELASTEKQDEPINHFITKEAFANEAPIESSQLPIFEIYDLLKEDYEATAYADAREMPDSAYMKIRQQTIVANIKISIKIGLTKYEDKISELSVLIETCKQQALIETIAEYQQKMALLRTHMEKLRDIEKDVNESGEITKGILMSYDMGFKRGLISISNDRATSLMR